MEGHLSYNLQIRQRGPQRRIKTPPIVKIGKTACKTSENDVFIFKTD